MHLHLSKREKHLLSVNCEAKNTLLSLEAIHETIFLSVSLYLLLLQLCMCIFPCVAVKGQDVSISYRDGCLL